MSLTSRLTVGAVARLVSALDEVTAEAPHKPISSFADCIFFNGLTRHRGKWWLYYGGSEYYTCLATSPAAHAPRGARRSERKDRRER